MALRSADRAMESATTTGTGAFSLAGAYTGYIRFSAIPSIATNDTVYYCIEALDGNGNPSGDWEVGLGTYSSANTLTRTTVHFSSNSNNAVNFAAGAKRVFADASATYLATFQSLDTQLTSLAALSYTGNTLKVIRVNAGETDFELATVSAGGNKFLLQWGPTNNEAPTSNYATLDTRNGHPTLDFDTTTQEAAIFSGVLPSDYAGAGITVTVYCALTSATSGTVGWLASIERMDASSLDIDADSFASAQTITATTVPGTSGQLLKLSVNISSGANMDSLAAGEMFRLKIERDVANDTATGDAELLRVTMKEQ